MVNDLTPLLTSTRGVRSFCFTHIFNETLQKRLKLQYFCSSSTNDYGMPNQLNFCTSWLSTTKLILYVRRRKTKHYPSSLIKEIVKLSRLFEDCLFGSKFTKPYRLAFLSIMALPVFFPHLMPHPLRI